ncbi:YciI family protein [uncultured Desulfuromonas sp.]|uniref:YciI family protein n=1 Tax=uncultured Desulfuromonas sp. TaxID=181013 RepID=UPI002AABDD3F|nr:YciI family protein [uncultured Desulfuromonas sp.]
MFIIELTYIRPLDEIDFFMKAHLDFLDSQYKQNRFIASGRKVPRTGGIILARADNRETIEQVVALDPFVKNQVARANIIEFNPTMTLAEFDNLQEPPCH